eukprot:TRINITY_DN17937_c0_g1_i1.p1 TRINITY_DN17937_c0_g1~~TRINITY_DN17937_c0_g1_i1.p1  ORF type:complete len:695 (+),score=124.75 TRINITY_DN17937_c0_g1_i1:64-2148(+)
MSCSAVGCNFGVWVGLAMVLALICVLYLMERRWKRRAKEYQEATGVMSQSRAFALNLVRHFMPSFMASRYQFRGMRPKTAKVSIQFENLSLQLPSGVTVLEGVSGQFKSGRMCAIMGPSGAGKTTFMNVLSGKATYGKMGGTVLVNDQKADVSGLKSVLGFVPQDDIVHQDLTVREQIRFSAELRNDSQLSASRLDRITDDVLAVMQIDHIQNSIVGGVEKRGISGGQRKRVNIGLELAAQPDIMFLDEPTSGLDSTSSLSVVLSLKKMCQLGMTSIMVIHQPRYSLFTLFDDVLLLGKGGHTVYLGPSGAAKVYFEELGFKMAPDENPADWLMDVICGEVPNSELPEFKPQMLDDLWKANGPGFLQRWQSSSRSDMGRAVNSRDDSVILESKLAEEWAAIDVNQDGVMDESELRGLLERCSGMMLDDAVSHELFMRMAGHEAKSVTRTAFLDYLCGLKGDVANDRLLEELDSVMIGPSEAGCSAANLAPVQELDLEEGDAEAKDLASLARRTPGKARQLRILTKRTLVQWWRKNTQRALFLGVFALGALILGFQDRFITKTPTWEASCYLNTQTTLALLVAVFCLQTFGDDRPLFWRESSHGLSIFGFYESRALVNMIDLFIQSFSFTALYFVIREPHEMFGDFWVPYIMVTWAASGWGYLISAIAPRAHAPFITALVIFVICGLLSKALKHH